MGRLKKELLARGLLPFLADNRIHVVPPCVVTDDEVAQALAIYDEVLSLDLALTPRRQARRRKPVVSLPKPPNGRLMTPHDSQIGPPHDRPPDTRPLGRRRAWHRQPRPAPRPSTTRRAASCRSDVRLASHRRRRHGRRLGPRGVRRGWRDTSIAKRQTVLFAFRELLNARKDELAAILTSEHGKVALRRARRDRPRPRGRRVRLRLRRTSSRATYSENVSTGVDVYSLKQPLGVVGIISPFNFPAMVPLWFFPIAIAAGNTVVLKPSREGPVSGATGWPSC